MKSFKLLLSVIVPLLISSCSAGSHVNSRNNLMASLFDKNSSETTSNAVLLTSSSNGSAQTPVYNRIDIDLTTMNSTMVYSEVYNMMVNPNQYVNKVVKASGPFVIGSSQIPNICYPAVLIQDATACCGNGLEFLLYGIPLCTTRGGDGYPIPGEEITIVGMFKTYFEDTNMYVRLEDSVWLR